MKHLYLTISLIFILALTGCEDSTPHSTYTATPVSYCGNGYSAGYFVGNPQCGHWTLSPTGQEVWVYYPKYSNLGPSTLDLALAAGAGALFYRSVWGTSNPDGWYNGSSYDRSRHMVVYNTVIKDYGSYDQIRTKAKSSEFKTKLSTYEKSNAGLPKPISKKLPTSGTQSSTPRKKVVDNTKPGTSLQLKKPGTSSTSTGSKVTIVKPSTKPKAEVKPSKIKLPEKKSTYSDRYKQMKPASKSYSSSRYHRK
jgi:hypothetical protein